MIRYRLMIGSFLTAAMLACCSPVVGQGGFKESDADGDAKVTAKELKEYVSGKMPGFERFDELMKELDSDQDGVLSEEEFAKRMTVVRSLMASPRTSEEAKDVQTGVDQRQQQQGRRRTRQRMRDSGLKVGQTAPTFALKSLDGKSETDLADFKGKRPVILIFGSYT